MQSRPIQSVLSNNGIGTYTPGVAGSAACLVGIPPPTQTTSTSNIEVYDEGVLLTPGVAQFNFTGTGVTASAVGNNVTVNVPGGSTPVMDNLAAAPQYPTAPQTQGVWYGQGTKAAAFDNNATVVGNNASTGSILATAIGSFANASGGGATAVGNSTVASGNTSTVVGTGATANADSGVALGTIAVVDVANGVVVGRAGSTSGVNNSIVLNASGVSRTPNDTAHALAIGVNASSDTASGLGVTVNGVSHIIPYSTSIPAPTITTQEEGTTLSSTVNTLNFVGQDITASGAGATTTITQGGLTSTVTSGTPVVLTAASTRIQVFTGSTAQTVTLPVVATPPASNGYNWEIHNDSTATMTVRTSGLNTLATLYAGQWGVATIVNTSGGTGTASWDFAYGTAGTPILDSAATPPYPVTGDTKGVWYGTNTKANAFDSSCVTIGPSSATTGANATVVGSGSLTAASQSVCVGYNSQATGVAAVCIGAQSAANNAGAVYIGQQGGAAQAAIGMGYQANAAGTNCVCVGATASAAGVDSVCIGRFAQNTAPSSASVAVGTAASVSGNLGIAIGYNCSANSAGSISIGTGTGSNSVSNAVALNATGGGLAPVDAAHALAFGVNSSSVNPGTLGLSVNNATYQVPMYSSLYATTATAAGTTTLTVTSAQTQYFTGSTTQTVKLPVVTTLANGWMFKIVNNSTGLVIVQSSGANTITVLPGNGGWGFFTCIDTTGGTGVASWGWESGVAQISGGTRVAVGSSAVAATGAVALGSSASASATNSVAIGITASSSGANSIAIGAGASATTSSTGLGNTAVASATGSTAIGYTATASGTNSVAIGLAAASSAGSATAIGAGASAVTQATGIGNTATASGTGSTAIGYLSTASITNSLAIGNGATVVDTAHAFGLGVNTTSVNPGTLGLTVNGASFVHRQYTSDFASTATAAGTTTLTVTSAQQQYFTGTTTQTVALPVATTLANGFHFKIANLSTGAVTVQTSGGNTVATLAAATAPASTWGFFTCINTAGGTGTASWSYDQGQ